MNMQKDTNPGTDYQRCGYQRCFVQFLAMNDRIGAATH